MCSPLFRIISNMMSDVIIKPINFAFCPNVILTVNIHNTSIWTFNYYMIPLPNYMIHSNINMFFYIRLWLKSSYDNSREVTISSIWISSKISYILSSVRI